MYKRREGERACKCPCTMQSHTFKGADRGDHMADIFQDAISRYCKQYGCNILLLQAIQDAISRYCKRYKLVVDKEWCSDAQVLKK